MNRLSVRTVNGEVIPESLIEPWWDLWRRCREATPFQSPAWLVPWWKTFSPGELAVICVYADDRLVGLAPFYIEHTARSRRALPIGIAISDYLDVLVDSTMRDLVGPVLITAIAAHAQSLTSWEFTELAPWSIALDLVAPPHCSEERGVSNLCLTLPIPPQATSLRDVVPAHRLQAVRNAWNRMRKTDTPQIVVGNAENADELFGALVSLHTSRWQRLGVSGALMDSRVCQFHHEVIPALAAAGMLRLYALRHGGEYIAVHYGFHHRGRTCAYLVGFDVTHDVFSPGTVLFAHAIEQALTEHATEFDFMRGGERYKYLWGARHRENQRRVLRFNYTLSAVNA